MTTYKQRVKNLLYYKAVKLKCYAFISLEIIADIDKYTNYFWEKFCKEFFCHYAEDLSDDIICPQCFIDERIEKNNCKKCKWGDLYGLCSSNDSIYSSIRIKFKNEHIVTILDRNHVIKIMKG